MITNESTLLGEVPKFCRAALSGEDVFIQTREGYLLIKTVAPKKKSVMGSLKGAYMYLDDLDNPTLAEDEWY